MNLDQMDTLTANLARETTTRRAAAVALMGGMAASLLSLSPESEAKKKRKRKKRNKGKGKGNGGGSGGVVLDKPPHVALGIFSAGALDSEAGMDNLRKLLGRDPDYLTWYQDWANGNFDEGNRRTLRRIDDRDMTPYIAWEPCDSDGHAIRQPKYSLSTIPQGNHDDYIDSWAEGLAEYGKPVFMNFAYEMNGDWFTWGVNVNGNDGGQDFQNAWRHIHGRFQRAGADNVVWVWSPNKTYDSIPASLEAVYPGDAYVDWLGMNGYNWGNSVMFGNHRSKWETFTQVFDRTYKELVALANKPILIGETASSEEGGRKNRWITSAFLSTIPNNYPNIRAITWFNAKRTGLTTKPGGGVKPTDAVDWRFTSSSKARKAFAHAVQNDYYRESLRTIEW